MEIDPVILVAGGAGLSVILIFWTIATAASGRKKSTFDRRMARARGLSTKAGPTEAAAQSLRLSNQSSRVPFVDLLMKNYLPRPALLLKRLNNAGLKFSLGEYLMLSICVGAVFGILGFVIFGGGILLPVLIGLAAAIALPHFMVNWLTARRLKAFTAEFPEAIDLIVRGLKAGLPVPASIRTVGDEIRPPLGTEFALISDRLRIGQNLDEALRIAAERIPTPEFNFFVISLAVQRETGGNLSETLENLSDILRKRRQMRQKIKAMSAEAKTSAMILGSLPFLMYGIMMLLNPSYLDVLFEDPRGLLMVGFGLASLLTGIAVMAKMVRFDI